MSTQCIFCNIISGVQPTQFLYQDEEIVIFRDITPAASHHYLAIPKKHIKDVNSLTVDHRPLLEKLVSASKKVLHENGGNVNDVRLGFHKPPFNSVQHLHLHVIAPVAEMSFLKRMIFKPNTWWFSTSDTILGNLAGNLR